MLFDKDRGIVTFLNKTVTNDEVRVVNNAKHKNICNINYCKLLIF